METLTAAPIRSLVRVGELEVLILDLLTPKPGISGNQVAITIPRNRGDIGAALKRLETLGK